MAVFDAGYPKRTGDDKEDITNIYNFCCELSDRLRYVFGLFEDSSEASGSTSEASGSTSGESE